MFQVMGQMMRPRYAYTPKPLLPIYPLCILFSFIDFLQKLLRYRSPAHNIVRALCITSAPLRALAIAASRLRETCSLAFAFRRVHRRLPGRQYHSP